MTEKENTHSEPTSPRNVAADAFVSIILLAGTFAAETIKGFIPKGVPLIITVILTVSEITLAVYFLVVLVRAVGYAFTEVEKVRTVAEGTRSWQVGKRSLGAVRALLRESMPNAKDFSRALKFGVRFVSVLAVAGVLFLLAVDFAPGRSTPAEKGTVQTLPRYFSEMTNPETARRRDSGVGAKAGSDDTRANTQAAPVVPPLAKRTAEPRGMEKAQPSREELQRQLEELKAQLEDLQKRHLELMSLLEEQYSSRQDDDSKRNYDTSKMFLESPRSSRDAQAKSMDGYGPPSIATPLPRFAVVFIYLIQVNRWRIIVGATAAACLTLLTTLFFQVRRRSARQE